MGRRALEKAVAYANERVVFGRPIGKNQSIQHPLAECWSELYAAELMTLHAAELYDAGKPCGAQANAAKYLAADAGFHACDRAIRTHGGMGYAAEYHVERYFREMVAVPARAGVARDDPELHRRARTRPAEVLLSRAMTDESRASPVVLVERAARALWISINREARRNAMNPDVIAGIHAAMRCRRRRPLAARRRADRASGRRRSAPAPISAPGPTCSRPRPRRADDRFRPPRAARARRSAPDRSRASTAPASPAAWG